MALTVLLDITEALIELLNDIPELKNDVNETGNAILKFLRFSNNERSRQQLNPKTYILKYPVVEEEAADLVDGIYLFYEKIAKEKAQQTQRRTATTAEADNKQKELIVENPSNVADFFGYVTELIKSKRVSMFSCKKPTKIDDVYFENLAGLEEEKEQLRVAYIYPQIYAGLFKSASRGVLLYGPPGTGKTMLVKAATNAIGEGVAFFSVTAGEIKDK